MADLSDKIEVAAGGPAEVTQDGTTVKQPPLPDQIEADRYLQGKTAAKAKSSGLRFFKFIFPGTS